jgi:hypothetical protein
MLLAFPGVDLASKEWSSMERSAPASFAAPYDDGRIARTGSDDVTASGVSWAAVIGGAFVAAAMSLILLTLGTGLGLSSVSPWSNAGASATAVGVGAIIWLIVAQIMAFGLGGYVAGRLRIKWATVHTDEVYFRDTAHGLLVWAVAAVVTAAALASVAGTMAGNATRATAGTRSDGDEALSAGVVDPTTYAVDGLFRSDRSGADRADPALRAEVARVLTTSVRHRELSPADKTYLATVVAARTGLSQSDAEQRVGQVFADLQQAINTARKNGAELSLWIFVALLTGAFCASYAATIGGRQRDHVLHP